MQEKEQFQVEEYAASLKSHYGFERDCVRARHHCNLRRLHAIRPQSIVEIGCGAEPLYELALAQELPFENWTVIEASTEFVETCRQLELGDHRLHVFAGLCEDIAAAPPAGLSREFDVVVLSSVLHEARDPDELLRASLSLVRPGGWVLVTCPNALSFHRLLAVAMGLAPTAHTLSARNVQFQQRIVFDHESLRATLEKAGVRELEFEGYMFKPFTHVQMEAILPLLPQGASEGLEELGRSFPVNAAEIAFAGRKP